MGAVEEAGKVATTAISALQGAPVFIALIFLQGLTMVGVAYSIHERAGYMAEERTQWSAERGRMLEYQKQVNDILSRCVVPGRTQFRPTIPARPAIETYDLPKPPLKPDDPPKPGAPHAQQ